MQFQWVRKNVNLTLLSESIEDFFKSKGFEVRELESAKGYRFLILPQQRRRIDGRIDVTVSGDPNDFVISFDIIESSGFLKKFGSILNLVGGGVFVLKSLKLEEALEKLEKEFWIHVQEKIGCLAS
jgi:hypothetical protein